MSKKDYISISNNWRRKTKDEKEYRNMFKLYFVKLGICNIILGDVDLYQRCIFDNINVF